MLSVCEGSTCTYLQQIPFFSCRSKSSISHGFPLLPILQSPTALSCGCGYAALCNLWLAFSGLKMQARSDMELITVRVEKPGPTNFVLGQSHFIKTIEDIHETLVSAVPGIKFGLAFCEASGKCLIRWSGTDPAMIDLAKKNAEAIGAGHS